MEGSKSHLAKPSGCSATAGVSFSNSSPTAPEPGAGVIWLTSISWRVTLGSNPTVPTHNRRSPPQRPSQTQEESREMKFTGMAQNQSNFLQEMPIGRRSIKIGGHPGNGPQITVAKIRDIEERI